MICKSCGTEIADKALICFRCGIPTSAPGRPAARPPTRRRFALVLPLLTLVVLALAALFLGRAGQVQVPPIVSYGVAVMAGVILVVRVWRRRRR